MSLSGSGSSSQAFRKSAMDILIYPDRFRLGIDLNLDEISRHPYHEDLDISLFEELATAAFAGREVTIAGRTHKRGEDDVTPAWHYSGDGFPVVGG